MAVKQLVHYLSEASGGIVKAKIEAINGNRILIRVTERTNLRFRHRMLIDTPVTAVMPR